MRPIALKDIFPIVIYSGNLAIQNQGFGIALTASGFSDVDGILGIGPADLTQGTTSGGGIVPTVTDNAFSQGSLTLDEVGISFEPTTSSSVQNGELTFGGIDSSKFRGSINYIPITATSPANKYVGIDQSITYGSARSSIMPTTAGITDTGTTLVLLPRDSYNAYTAATGAVADQTTGLLTISAAQYSNLQSLFFTIGGVEYEFTKNAQTFPRALNTAIGGTANGIYLVIGNSGSSTGSGLDFIDGYAFLERFYSVYSTGASQFGIATTPFTFATTN
ncbi:aspartic peptidase domain-containing protein [Irpex lacteus]|nr:aspartic peptidase domain-containing protein [Irpex lacteus]